MKKLLLLFLVSCGQEEDVCSISPLTNQFEYKTNFNQTTPDGVKTDLSGQGTELLGQIDTKIKETETCVKKLIPDFSINRQCLRVKIPNDWVLSCDGTEQLLPWNAPQELCNQKGFLPDPNCPCLWRAGYQKPDILVSTPNLHLFKDPLIRMFTNWNNPWEGIISECSE